MLNWFDIETTGLDPESDHLLEVGCIITDDQLNEVARMSLLIAPEIPLDQVIEQASPWARKTHTENGLWDELRDSSVPKAEAEARFSEIVTKHGDGNLLAGSSVHFDRAWLKKHMPGLETLFHYRNLDVSVVREVFRLFSPVEPGLPANTAGGNHRALGDLQDSIDLLKHYISELGWEVPV